MTQQNESREARAHTMKRRLVTAMYPDRQSTNDPELDSYLVSIPAESNIVGFGFGIKWTGAGIGAEEAVRVYVRAKQPRHRVAIRHRIPEEIDGIPTDVIAVGRVRPAFPRPTACGVSGSNEVVSAEPGTLGCLVERNGTRFILSNNHILANINGAPGALILEPARDDGGASNPPIAHLTDRQEILFGGPVNNIDAAIAELTVASDMTPDIELIGHIDPSPLDPLHLMSVIKHGRTTLLTNGVIDDVHADIGLGLPPHGVAFFHNQFTVSNLSMPFSAGGDSGSLVLEATTHRPLGLLFAIANGITYCNRIQPVLDRFAATIVS